MTETLALVEEPHPLVEVCSLAEVAAGERFPAPVYFGEPAISTDLIYCFALGLIVGLGIYQITRGGR